MESQADQNHNMENSSPFLAERSPSPFSALNFSKRRPLQDITHLFPINGSTRSISDGRGMSSAVEMRGFLDRTSKVGNKKRKSTNMSDDGNISSSNLKRPLLRRDFR